MSSLKEKISVITAEIGAIKKEKQPGSSVSYAYRSIDDVMNKLNPLLAKHNITLQSRVLSYNLTPREFLKYNSYTKKEETKHSYCASVHFQLIFSSGDEQEIWEEVAMSEDYGDKALTQAMSMAYKYAITRKFCILTADVVDPDGRTPDRGEDAKPTPPPPTNTKQQPKPTPPPPAQQAPPQSQTPPPNGKLKLSQKALEAALLRVGKEQGLYTQILDMFDVTSEQREALDKALVNAK